jgi:hypothetical protein
VQVGRPGWQADLDERRMSADGLPRELEIERNVVKRIEELVGEALVVVPVARSAAQSV